MADQNANQRGSDDSAAGGKLGFIGKLLSAMSTILSPLQDIALSAKGDAPAPQPETPADKKRMILLIILALIVSFILLTAVWVLRPKPAADGQQTDPVASGDQSGHSSGEEQGSGKSKNGVNGAIFNGTLDIPNIPDFRPNSSVVDDAKIGGLIRKADILYKSGQKDEAMDVFHDIANFSGSIANYNLGVISFKSNELQKSLEYYDKAISTGEDVSISALNAASTAHAMGDEAKFKYYSNIADTYIGNITNDPPRSYAIALNSYYKGNYFETLSPLTHPTSNLFDSGSKRLLSKMYTLFNDNAKAFDALKSVAKPQDDLALGQLLARDGRLDEARGYLERYAEAHPHDPNALISLELVAIKQGDYKTASTLLYTFQNLKYRDGIRDPYPIKVRVSPLVFDSTQAQRYFWENTFSMGSSTSAKILFYYAPYKVFDVIKAADIITDGVMYSRIDKRSIQQDDSVLVRSATVSEINTSIAKSLKMVNNNDLRGALKKLQAFLDRAPNYSILHYNVGLMHAQLGNFSSAHKHFLKSYQLDGSDLQAGVLALLSGKIVYKDLSILNQELSQSIADSKLSEDDLKFFVAFKQWVNDPRSAYYAAHGDSPRPVDYALQAVTAFDIGKHDAIASAAKSLFEMYPDDIVSRVLFDLSRDFRGDIKSTSLGLQYLFSEERMRDKNLDSVFYGPSLARELYAHVGFITGNLAKQRDMLNYKLSTQTGNPNGILQALGLVNLYMEDFEVSYSLYDQLINKLGEDDSDTRFLGAVAAIGSGRNMIAGMLLQLSKMESPSNYESRYALGLLYQENGHHDAAANNFIGMSKYRFKSKFVDFIVDESKLQLPK